MKTIDLYRWMMTCRQLETAMGRKNPRWFATEGEEAVIVGSFASLRAGDIAAPHYRGPLVVYLMRGAELNKLVSQAFGKTGGYNKGRGAPYLGPGALNLVPWVAGDLGTSIGVATGAAMALKHQRQGHVCVCAFGDGTSNRGDFHENINTAALWKLPIVYVCQNNGWAISQNTRSYLPAPVVDRAQGYGIPGVLVDGNDVEAVQAAVSDAMKRAAAGEGPTLIEARTWRRGGHWANDKTPYRTADDEARARMMPDPVARFEQQLLDRGTLTPAERDRIRSTIEAAIEAAIAYAAARPDAGRDELGLSEVFAAQP